MASSAVGALNAVMGIDTSGFDAGLKRAEAKITGLDFSKAISAGLGDVKRTLSSTAGATGALGAALGGLGIAGVAAAAAIGGSYVEVRKALAFGDDIADTAKRLAVTTDELQEYRYAVHALGGDYADADTALEGFSKAFGAAQAGLSKKALKPFEKLGLDPKSFATTGQALDAVIDRISKLKSTAEQAALADKLGLSAALPAIRDGTRALTDLRLEAHAAGAVMGSELVESAGAMNDRLEQISQQIDVQFKSSMVELAPLVLTLAEAFLAVAKAVGKAGDGLAYLRDHQLLRAIPGVGGLAQGLADTAKARGKKARVAALLKGNRDLIAGNLERPTGAVADLGGGGGGGRGRRGRGDQVADASAEAIAQAAGAELAARQALTGDIQQLAELRVQEIRQDAEAAKSRLDQRLAYGEITKAARDQAYALTEDAAKAREALVRRETDAALDRQLIASREEIAAYYDQVAGIEAQRAAGAAAAAAIEEKALAKRQGLERARLESETAAEVLAGQRTENSRDALLAAQADLQAAQRKAQAEDAAAAAAAERVDLLQGQVDAETRLLDSQAGLTDSEGERAKIALRILDLQHRLERAKLEELAATSKVGSVQRQLAQDSLRKLGQAQGNERAAAERDVVVGKLHDAGDAISRFAESFDSNTANKIADGFNNVANAFATGGPVAAAMAAFGELGKAVGGSTGAFLQGFGSGGLVGGVLSLIGHKKAKRKAKKAAAAKAKAEAEEKAKELAAAKRALEIEILDLEGKSLEAVAARRADELAAADASLKPLLERKFALEDEAAAAEKAAQLVADRTALERELLHLTDDAAGVAADRADELAALDASLRPLQQAIYDVIDANAAREASEKALAEATKAVEAENAARIDAAQKGVDDARDALRASFEHDAEALRAAADKFEALADDLHALADRLKGEGLAADPARNLAAAKAAFDKINARIAAGDSSALDDLAGAAEAFSEASKSGAKSALENARNQAAARKAVAAGEALARAQVDVAHQQLDALTDLVDGQIEVRDAVLSVSEALGGLSSAVFGLASAQAHADQALYDLLHPLATSPAALAPPALTPINPDAIGAALDTAMLEAAPALTAPGAMTSNADVVDLMGSVLTAIEQNAVNTGQLLRLNKRWDGDGMPDVRVVA